MTRGSGFNSRRGLQSMSEWKLVSVMDLPMEGFVLAFVQFDEPYVRPAIHVAYLSPHDGRWRTRYGRLHGTVTHWMPLPEPPVAAR